MRFALGEKNEMESAHFSIFAILSTTLCFFKPALLRPGSEIVSDQKLPISWFFVLSFLQIRSFCLTKFFRKKWPFHREIPRIWNNNADCRFHILLTSTSDREVRGGRESSCISQWILDFLAAGFGPTTIRFAIGSVGRSHLPSLETSARASRGWSGRIWPGRDCVFTKIKLQSRSAAIINYI